MPAAVATAPPAPNLIQRASALPGSVLLRLGLALAVLAAVVVVGLVLGRQADWRVLYANLADKDGGAVVAQLSQMNVPYKVAEGGGAILVPADRVHDTRLRLATQGLPRGSVAGFELMESNRLGMTQFQERLNFQRGLEGELTRSIQALSSVQSARVHLALPNQNGFFREQQKPSASVLLSLHPGRTLDRSQIAGIVHLVASSVPEMPPAAVSVLDDTGKLLSSHPDGAGGADAQQLQYVQQIEQLYARRILEILEPLVGRNNVRAQVTAEVDFSQSEQTSESHRPNQAADASAVRSQQIVESGPGVGLGATPGGVPGATSNQPPAPAAAPINGAAQPVAAAGAQAAGGGQGAGANAAGKRESIVNYEVDKTVRVVRAGSGAIKRISAAVVLNHQSVTDDKGKTTSTPLSNEQVERITALVRETVGFNKDRGDSVNVLNAPFAVEKPVVVDVPVWRQPEVMDLARSLAWPVGTLAIAALVLLGFVRPALKALSQAQATAAAAPATGSQLDAVVADETERAPLLPAPQAAAGGIAAESPEQLRLQDARRLTRENPAAVANIVKGWIGSEAAT